jgi:hypothetical protein
VSGREYTNFDHAYLSVELARKDLDYALHCLANGDMRDFVMRVEWAHNQLESAVARLKKEKGSAQ